MDIKKEITLSSGVVLGIGTVPPFVLSAAMAELGRSRPEVPKVYIKDYDRWEENPDDPVYQESYALWQAEFVDRQVRILIGLASKVVSIPSGFEAVDDDSWIEMLEAVGMDVSRNGSRRYIDWVRMWAITDNADIPRLIEMLRQENGTPEEEVAAAAESFPGDEGWGTD